MKPPVEVMQWSAAVATTLFRLNLHPSAAKTVHLDPNLILAMIWQESGGDAWAIRPERFYPYLMNVRTWLPFRQMTVDEKGNSAPPPDFPYLGASAIAEWWGQRMSWGLLQVMGAAARERGFKERYLSALCDPVTGIEYGLLHWWYYATQCGNRPVRDSLLRWNGGGNQEYDDEVLAKLDGITPTTTPV